MLVHDFIGADLGPWEFTEADKEAIALFTRPCIPVPFNEKGNPQLIADWFEDKITQAECEARLQEAYAAAKPAPLPAHYYRLDRPAALRALTEGVRRWGVEGALQADLPKLDVMVQVALLGEVKYQ